MDFPPISVIVPIYNGEKDLPDLLDCLEKQTYPRDRRFFEDFLSAIGTVVID
jgi:glycosyltransferase involved in cell wall biosynthesis